jgi:tRNA pseudouridine38-40 synthase
MRLKLTIQYDGTEYHGWQIQPGAATVQGALSAALEAIEEAPVTLFGAGRTDAGVHALGQVAHVDVSKRMDPQTWARAINAHVDRDIRVTSVEEAAPDFHALRSAVGKTYAYRVWVGPFVSPFVRRYVAHAPHEVDVERMRHAAAALVGRHDFEAFTVSDRETLTTVRDVRRLEIDVDGEMLTMTAEADGFLRAMVRTIAGTLLAIGDGRLPVSAVEDALRERKREFAGPTAPAAGLTLVRVDY